MSINPRVSRITSRFLAAGCLFVCSIGAAEERANDPAARQLMLTAHDSRAVWNDFPGFTADVMIRTDGVVHNGKLTVGKDFECQLDIAKEAQQPWVKAKLRSVISHRRPDDFSTNGFAFIKETGASSEAGQLVEELDGSGVFRIKDGILLEVIRKDDSQWMEISNLDLLETAEGKQLPEVSSVTFRDPKSGDLKSNVSNTFEWKRFGSFDLPTRTFTVETGASGTRSVREIVFTNHKLN
jgi:hypothetical protein